MVGSMGQVGAAGDNAAMESFFALLQKNVLDRQRWTTRDELRIAIVTWIERTYHRRRRQARPRPIAYQLSGVAQSLDDYYTGAGEAAGVWSGTGAARLGLEGEVVPDDLRAVLAGIRPGTGGLDPNGDQIRPHARRVPGFDLTFKAPKSVSVLYAVSDDPRVQGAIVDAGEAAVRASLGWLEREAVHVRRGSGDKRWLADLALRDPDAAERAALRVEQGQGLVAAMFRHRTSRAGDPLLHWHTLVANSDRGPRWALVGATHPGSASGGARRG